MIKIETICRYYSKKLNVFFFGLWMCRMRVKIRYFLSVDAVGELSGYVVSQLFFFSAGMQPKKCGLNAPC